MGSFPKATSPMVLMTLLASLPYGPEESECLLDASNGQSYHHYNKKSHLDSYLCEIRTVCPPHPWIKSWSTVLPGQAGLMGTVICSRTWKTVAGRLGKLEQLPGILIYCRPSYWKLYLWVLVASFKPPRGVRGKKTEVGITTLVHSFCNMS